MCMFTLFVTSIFTVCIVSSLPEKYNEIVSESIAPLSNGFHLMFGISYQMAIALSIPATYATAYGFIFASGNVLIV